MSDYTAKDVLNAINADGTTVDGEKAYGEDVVRMLWWEFGDPGVVIDTLDLGQFEVVESVIGKRGKLTSEYGGNTWENYIVVKQGDRYFKFNGEYDSWDAQGPDGTVEEVEKVEKTIYVWEQRHDY